ncbi:MAG: DUF1461 domain-containing protein [Eubacteriaceae bacterium]|nr:DUF1461 domain-containing protein [Eubacteriaceae bacterium]
MRKNKIANALFFLIAAPCIFLVIGFTVIEAIAMGDSFYQKQFEKQGISAQTGVSQDGLMDFAHEVQNLLSGKGGLSSHMVVNGQSVETFGEQELFHMDEVADLFGRFSSVRFSLAVAFFALFTAFYMLDNRHAIANVLACCLANLAGIAAIATMAAMDFDLVFTVFHEILFDNDLWMFPSNSMLIRILTEEFFMNFAAQAGICIAIILLGISIFAACMLQKRKKKELANGD